jgi:hypothetical protein
MVGRVNQYSIICVWRPLDLLPEAVALRGGLKRELAAVLHGAAELSAGLRESRVARRARNSGSIGVLFEQSATSPPVG